MELAVLDDSPVPNHYPEGGLRAYCAVAGGALLLVSTFALSNSFGVFLQEYQKVRLCLPSFPPSATLPLTARPPSASTRGLSRVDHHLDRVDSIILGLWDLARFWDGI